MATFSINQVTHLFAAVGNVGAASGNFLKDADVQSMNLGDIIIGNPNGVAPDKVNLWVAQKGHGGIVRSDVVKPSNICWIRAVDAYHMADTPKVLTISLDSNVNSGNPIVGQDYILTFTIDNVLSPSQEDKFVVHAAARAFSTDTAATLMGRIQDSLDKSIKRMFGEYVPVAVTLSGSNIVLTEQFPYWEAGKFQYRRANFFVNPGTVTDQNTSMEVVWGAVAESAGATPFENGAKVADLEYFALGARGSEERGMGWPYNIETKGFLPVAGTPIAEQAYDLFIVHYYYAGANTNNQKSERDLVIACPHTDENPVMADVITQVSAVLTAAGVSTDIIVVKD